ncbi:glycosyltransferase WbuB [Serratia fonticola]|uniref:Glycosyltransferase WbuB n=1 Tax=Serratia fonticola TaxID=47917 RepID=A0AAE7JUC1_SERFO|nr:glycosyltransferase WbuB [Serratia fonticola]MCO7509739.1 glycosyltransferase WbuB [Serratia fonticola]QKJ59771.1 glycosyltransferase WbuB [Serratia fonticola]
MKILVYGINYYPELTGIGKYSGEMCEWLVSQGHEVKVVTAPPYYPQWRIQSDYKNHYSREVIKGVDVHRCPLYVPKKLSLIKRIIHLLSFSITSSIKLLTLVKWKPDVTICVVPTLFCSLTALGYSKFSGSKSIIHIQDYELDAMFGLGMNSGKLDFLRKTLFKIEGKILKYFDAVSTISYSMIDKAKQKGVAPSKILFFPNWTNVSHFSREYETQLIRNMFNISSSKKIILYSGNIGEKQGVDIIIDAAKCFYGEDVVFLIVGSGAGKEKLVELVNSNDLQNFIFSELLPYEQLPDLLASASCHLVIQKKGVADAVLPSKLTNIFAVGGHSVITAEKDTELGILCENNKGIAVLVEPENVLELVRGIRNCLKNNTDNQIARSYAKKYLDRDNILISFITNLSKL